MEYYHILGYIGALFVGVILGLIGGGGSILTVPILVYIMKLHPVTATGYSLFVVGITALMGAFQKIRKSQVDFKLGILFSIPAFITIYLTRKYIIPALPDTLFYVVNFEVTKQVFIMVFFAIVMLLASLSMIWSKPRPSKSRLNTILSVSLVIIQGIFIGLLSGIVGAGGGFLIVPMLIFISKLSIKNAIGTSLVIIAINALIGFLGDVTHLTIDWSLLITFTLIAIAGVLIGGYLSKITSSQSLKKGFGWFTLVMALYIMFRELK